MRLSGTREGVNEARRRLEVTMRTIETSIQAPPELAAALRANGQALTRRIEHDFRLRIYIGGAGGGDLSCYAVGLDERGRSSAGRVSNGPNVDNNGAAGQESSYGMLRGGGAAAAAAVAVATVGSREAGAVAAVGSGTVHLSGLPEDVEAARVYIVGLACLGVVVAVERRALPSIIGTAGANVRQLEVRCMHEGRSSVLEEGMRRGLVRQRRDAFCARGMFGFIGSLLSKQLEYVSGS